MHVPYNIKSSEEHSVVMCSLLSVALSTPKSDIWEKIASLPMMKSELVTFKGHLLTVRGEPSKEVFTKEIYEYNPSTDSWQVISQMNVARSDCAAALLPNSKLMVVGGASLNPIELATVLLH